MMTVGYLSCPTKLSIKLCTIAKPCGKYKVNIYKLVKNNQGSRGFMNLPLICRYGADSNEQNILDLYPHGISLNASLSSQITPQFSIRPPLGSPAHHGWN